MPKYMNHSEYQRKMHAKSIPELEFIVKDAGESAALNGENAGYYMDEVHYASAELRKRFGRNGLNSTPINH